MPGGTGKGFFDRTWASTFNTNVSGATTQTITLPSGKKVLEIELRGGTASPNYAEPAYTNYTSYNPQTFSNPAYSNYITYDDNFTTQEAGYSRSFNPVTPLQQAGYTRTFNPVEPLQQAGYTRNFNPVYYLQQAGYSRSFTDNYYVVQGGYTVTYNPNYVEPVQEFGYTVSYNPNYYAQVTEFGYTSSFNPNYVEPLQQAGYSVNNPSVSQLQESGYSNVVNYNGQQNFRVVFIWRSGEAEGAWFPVWQPGYSSGTSYNPNYINSQPPATSYSPNYVSNVQEAGYNRSFNPNYVEPVQEFGYNRSFSPNYYAQLTEYGYSRSFNPNVAIQEYGYTRTFNPVEPLQQAGYSRSFNPVYYLQEAGYSRSFNPVYYTQQAGYTRSFNPNYTLQQQGYTQIVTSYPERITTQPSYTAVQANYPERITLGASGSPSSLVVTADDGSTFTMSAPATNTPANAFVSTTPPTAPVVYATLFMPVVHEDNNINVTLGASPASNTSATYRPYINVRYDATVNNNVGQD